jgi:thymidylate synthase
LNTRVYSNENTTQIYMDALLDLVKNGEQCSPRGKVIKELRPVVIEYTNPRNRVTFLKGRVINPFFQLAEALWIIEGRSDVKWLAEYNSNIGQFSDDGTFFNAPYGERLRNWNKSDANRFILNPIDQLRDVYNKIKTDKDTRQAVAVIYNPLFDNSDHHTKDTPCNMLLTFKVRNNKLDLTVYNRSNDLHWGTFGANLCQFSTIQEMMASWLDVGIGTYYQVTDSLHIYMDDYGSKETDKIFKAYDMINDMYISTPVVNHFVFDDEPRMSSNFDITDNILGYYFGVIDPLITNPDMYTTPEGVEEFTQPNIEFVREAIANCPDDYFRMTFNSMLAYQAHKHGNMDIMCNALALMEDSSWKVSCLRFLSKRYSGQEQFTALYQHLSIDIKGYIERKGE